MMTTLEILKLVEAGFTKEEILKLEPTSTPKPETPPSEPEPHKPQESDAMLAIRALTEQVTKQAELFNKMAILNSQQPKQETVADIMASIINPTKEVNNG